MAATTSERGSDEDQARLRRGRGGEAAPYIAFNTFNMMFYNSVLGLSGTLCGLAVAHRAGARRDRRSGDRVLVGPLAPRLGRRHPFMYAAPIPLAITLLLHLLAARWALAGSPCSRG